MKKIKSLVLITMMMVVALSSQAFGYFEQGNLVMAVYANTDACKVELATDLGIPAGIDWTATNAVVANIDLNAFNADLSDIRVGYFATLSSTYQFYYATVDTTNPGIKSSGISGHFGGVSSVYREYEGTAQTVVGSSVADGSYNQKMNQGGTNPGYYGNINPNPIIGETALADLATVGYVDMYLYHFNGITPVQGTDPVTGAATDYIGVLRLAADGTTTLNPTAVPIPASLLLFGSGLLGFVGIRRKNS